MKIEVHAIIKGTVQKVGFRASTARIAANMPLSGFVRNLPDETVEILVQGEGESIKAFFSALYSISCAKITSISQEERPVSSSFDHFTARFDS